MSTDAQVRRAAHAVVMPGFVGQGMPDWLGPCLDAGLAGVWIFGHNVQNLEQVGALARAIHERAPQALVASDEEGGTVTRLEQAGGSSWPGHASLGRVDDVRLTEAVATELGGHAAACGVDLVAAPDADVSSEVGNPVIGVRSFGADPGLVARHTAAFVRGLRTGGVLSCAKHFPGHGATTRDSHVDLPRVDAAQDVVRGRDLPPFAAAVDAGVDVLMTAHVVYGAWAATPATITPELIDLARTELGFTGVICTDALDMAAIDQAVGRHQGAVSALAAGVDLICLGNPAFPRDYDAASDLDAVVVAIVSAVQQGQLPAERLHEAAGRVAVLGHRQASRRSTSHVGRVFATPSTPVGRGFATSDAPLVGVSAGVEAARRAVRLQGPPPETWDRPLVVAVDGALNIASGVRSRAFLAAMADAWPALAVGEDRTAAAAHDGDLVVVTDDRTDLDAAGEVLRRAAAVVHLGIGPPPLDRVPAGCPVLTTGGGGRASAAAAARALQTSRPAEENA